MEWEILKENKKQTKKEKTKKSLLLLTEALKNTLTWQVASLLNEPHNPRPSPGMDFTSTGFTRWVKVLSKVRVLVSSAESMNGNISIRTGWILPKTYLSWNEKIRGKSRDFEEQILKGTKKNSLFYKMNHNHTGSCSFLLLCIEDFTRNRKITNKLNFVPSGYVLNLGNLFMRIYTAQLVNK